MHQRTLVVAIAAIMALGLVLDAPVSAKAPHGIPPAAPATLAGTVIDWSSAGTSVTVGDPELLGGSRQARRALRGLDELILRIGPRTRIVRDDDGLRERIGRAALIAELEEGQEELEITAVVSVSRTTRKARGVRAVNATRIVLHLPWPADEEDVAGDDDPDPEDGGDEPGDGSSDAGDEPVEPPID